ncbi:MAG: N-6 DNA methylase [Verrucomicrobiota bacterium]
MPEETYRTIIEQIARRKSSSVTVFADFCRMVACALAMQTREEEYFEAIKGYSKDELELLSKAMGLLVMETEKAPFTDVLGTYYTEIGSRSSQKDRGEFYTPQHVSQLMAKITIDAKEIIERGIPITLNEPASGAGGMILAIAEEFAPEIVDGKPQGKSYVDLLRVTCQDINPIAVDMCYINTTLWGIPAHIIQGNALSNEIVHSWKNIHWLRVCEDERQSFLQMMRLITNPPKKPSEAPEPFTAPIKGNQVEFDFDLTP